MTNLNTAFDVAEKYLDIPKMLDAEGELKRRLNAASVAVLICHTVYSEPKVTAERRKILQQQKEKL